MKDATIDSRTRSAAEDSTVSGGPDGVSQRVGPLVVLMRVATALGLLTTLVLATVAGMFTTGDIEMLRLHGTLSIVLAATVLVQLVLTVLIWRRNRALWWAPVAGLLILIMTVLQIGMGETRTLSLHMPLGMAICAAEALLMFWAYGLRGAWRAPAAARGRTAKADRTDDGSEAAGEEK
ncbi:hypothetical protein [Streptomyces rubiginosohelvolus]|uniref:hypothetical protein n=1 Tax=Streptomyces rubiginosohelvolus TaxID=67362 RepID=UPI0036C38F10